VGVGESWWLLLERLRTIIISPPGRDAQSHSVYLCLNIARWHTDLPPSSCTIFCITVQSSYMFWSYIYIYAIFRELQSWSTCTAYIATIWTTERWLQGLDKIGERKKPLCKQQIATFKKYRAFLKCHLRLCT